MEVIKNEAVRKTIESAQTFTTRSAKTDIESSASKLELAQKEKQIQELREQLRKNNEHTEQVATVVGEYKKIVTDEMNAQEARMRELTAAEIRKMEEKLYSPDQRSERYSTRPSTPGELEQKNNVNFPNLLKEKLNTFMPFPTLGQQKLDDLQPPRFGIQQPQRLFAPPGAAATSVPIDPETFFAKNIFSNADTASAAAAAAAEDDADQNNAQWWSFDSERYTGQAKMESYMRSLDNQRRREQEETPKFEPLPKAKDWVEYAIDWVEMAAKSSGQGRQGKTWAEAPFKKEAEPSWFVDEPEEWYSFDTKVKTAIKKLFADRDKWKLDDVRTKAWRNIERYQYDNGDRIMTGRQQIFQIKRAYATHSNNTEQYSWQDLMAIVFTGDDSTLEQWDHEYAKMVRNLGYIKDEHRMKDVTQRYFELILLSKELKTTTDRWQMLPTDHEERQYPAMTNVVKRWFEAKNQRKNQTDIRTEKENMLKTGINYSWTQNPEVKKLIEQGKLNPDGSTPNVQPHATAMSDQYAGGKGYTTRGRSPGAVINQMTCDRCGRTGHTAPYCRTQLNRDGSFIRTKGKGKGKIEDDRQKGKGKSDEYKGKGKSKYANTSQNNGTMVNPGKPRDQATSGQMTLGKMKALEEGRTPKKCHYYAYGKCQAGKDCMFAHDKLEPHEKQALIESNWKPAQGTKLAEIWETVKYHPHASAIPQENGTSTPTTPRRENSATPSAGGQSKGGDKGKGKGGYKGGDKGGYGGYKGTEKGGYNGYKGTEKGGYKGYKGGEKGNEKGGYKGEKGKYTGKGKTIAKDEDQRKYRCLFWDNGRQCTKTAETCYWKHDESAPLPPPNIVEHFNNKMKKKNESEDSAASTTSK